MERWTGTPEGTCNVLRMFRETHAISAIVSSTSQDASNRTQLPSYEKAKCNLYVTFRKNKILRGVLSMPLYSMKEGKDDERN